jgi:hypothetical protein
LDLLSGFTYILTLVGPDREENPKGYLVFQFIRAVLLSTQAGHITSRIIRLIKKEKKIFLIYNEIQNGAVAKSYMTSGLLIYGEIFAHFLIYVLRSPFLIYDFATAPL